MNKLSKAGTGTIAELTYHFPVNKSSEAGTQLGSEVLYIMAEMKNDFALTISSKTWTQAKEFVHSIAEMKVDFAATKLNKTGDIHV